MAYGDLNLFMDAAAELGRNPVPAGSLEAAAQSMAQEISKNHDEWEKRRHALVSMQDAIEEVAKSGQGGPSVFTADLWRYLKEPLKHTLNDLRSAIVKEACMLLEKLSTAAGNSMAPFMRDVLNVLLQLLTNGNSVITAQVDSCMRHVIEHTRFPRQLKEMEYMVRNSRSKDLREMVASYVRLILGTWPAASMEREIASLESLVSMQMADASSAARTDARASFGLFQQHWPKRAGKILEGADPRTAKTLREEYGLDEDAASTAGRRTPTKAKAPARSSLRAPKPTGAGAGTAAGRGVETSKPFLKKGSSSSEGSARVGGGGGASGGVNGNGNGNGQTPPSPTPATLKPRRTVSSPSPSKAPSSSTNKKTGSSIAPPSPAASSSSTLGAAGGRRRPLHAPARASISPTSPPAPGSGSQTRRKQRFLMRTAPGSSVSRARPKTAGHSPLFVGSGAKARPPLIASSSAPLLVSTDGFLAGGASVRSVATSLSRGGGGKATSPDGSSGSGSNVASEMVGLTPLVPGDKVRLKGSPPRSAIVRYVGETQFATGIWVGVELSRSAEPPGNNNGSVNGVPYFRCPPTRGIFLRADMVELEDVTDDGDSESFAAEWWGAKGVRGQTGLADGVEATEGEEEAMIAGAELLRCHKLFMNEAMEALKDEVGTIRGLEGAVESGEVISSDRLRYFLEILESAAEAREAAASRLRAQIRQAARRHPGIFDTPIPSDFLNQSLYSDHGSLFGPDCAGEKYDEEEAGVVQGGEAKKDVSNGTGGQEDAIDGGGSGSASAKPPRPGQEVATVTKYVTPEIERGEGDSNGKGAVGLAGKLLRQVLHVPDRSEWRGEAGKDGDDRAAVVAAVVAAAVEEVVVTSSPSAPDPGKADKDDFGVKEGEEKNTDFDSEGGKGADCAGVETPPAKDVAVDM